MNALLSAIFKFCTSDLLFKCFQRRYSDQQLNILIKLFKTCGKITSAISQTAFLTLSKFIKFQIEKLSALKTLNIECAFMFAKIEKVVMVHYLITLYFR